MMTNRYLVLPRLIQYQKANIFLYGDTAVVFGGETLSSEFVEHFKVKNTIQAKNTNPEFDSVLIYDKPGINYTSSAQVCKDFDTGYMYSISGSGFYRVLSTDLAEIMHSLGVSDLQGYVVGSHVRLMAMQLRSVGTVEVLFTGKLNNIEMHWVKVKVK